MQQRMASLGTAAAAPRAGHSLHVPAAVVGCMLLFLPWARPAPRAPARWAARCRSGSAAATCGWRGGCSSGQSACQGGCVSRGAFGLAPGHGACVTSRGAGFDSLSAAWTADTLRGAI